MLNHENQCAGLLTVGFRCRLLVERLAKVDPSAMTHEQKLAFWINLYNALLMHVSALAPNLVFPVFCVG